MDFYQRAIRRAVTPLLGSFVRATIFGRWVAIRGAAWMEPYAVGLVNTAGKTEIRGYDLDVFPPDDRPHPDLATSFTSEVNEQIMSVLMDIAEKTLRFDELVELGRRPKARPTGLFWFSDDQKACFAYEAIGERAFAETRYARLAENWRTASKSSSLVEGSESLTAFTTLGHV